MCKFIHCSKFCVCLQGNNLFIMTATYIFPLVKKLIQGKVWEYNIWRYLVCIFFSKHLLPFLPLLHEYNIWHLLGNLEHNFLTGLSKREEIYLTEICRYAKMVYLNIFFAYLLLDFAMPSHDVPSQFIFY